MQASIDYQQLSINLGLHKPSLNLMSSNTGAVRTEHVTRRLMQQLGHNKKGPSPIRADLITAPENKN